MPIFLQSEGRCAGIDFPGERDCVSVEVWFSWSVDKGSEQRTEFVEQPLF